MNGIFVGYFTGSSGNGFAMFVFLDGRIVGADPIGFSFDGTYSEVGEQLRVQIEVSAPANAESIQGLQFGSQGGTYAVDTQVPKDITKWPYIIIPTPLGEVSVKFRKLKDV
jgi:hypothetical protein